MGSYQHVTVAGNCKSTPAVVGTKFFDLLELVRKPEQPVTIQAISQAANIGIVHCHKVR